jgi:3-hydroxybutyryl-CoA dehydrogenase
METIRNTGVVGAGVMGTGVAQALAQAGYCVVLIDSSEAALEKAKGEIYRGVRFHHFLRRGGEPQNPDEVSGRITFSQDLAALAQSDFVIENVTEAWAVKQPVYTAIDRICPEHCIFAADTSAIPITQIGGATNRPDRVLGMHFMNPVPLKDTVEVIRGFHTSEATLQAARKLLGSMGKEAIVVNDSPGFVSNRVLMLTVNEAIQLVHEGVASAEDVDKVFRQCFGHKMGPLETGDLIGLDTILLSLEVLQEQFGDPKFRPCPLLRKMVHAGLLGRKTGQGFYQYV